MGNNEDANSQGTSGEVDEKGVPLINRFREMERKFEEKYDKELAAARQELQELKISMQSADESKVSAKKLNVQERLTQFVSDPDGFIEDQIQKREADRQKQAMNAELAQVRPWLATKKDYNPEKDNPKLLEIENRYALGHASPLQRVQAAWDILERERAYERVNSMTDDQRREINLGSNQTEGAGKAITKQSPITRNDVIRKLAEAEQKGDLDAAIRYTSMLEDIR